MKERLKEYLWIKENIEELEDRLLEIDTQLTKVTTQITADKVSATKDPDKWTNLISQRIEVENRINREIAKGLEEMKLIEDLIQGLSEKEKYLMRLRYIKGLKWEQICCKMHYEWRQVHNIHSRALSKLNDCTQVH